MSTQNRKITKNVTLVSLGMSRPAHPSLLSLSKNFYGALKIKGCFIEIIIYTSSYNNLYKLFWFIKTNKNFSAQEQRREGRGHFLCLFLLLDDFYKDWNTLLGFILFLIFDLGKKISSKLFIIVFMGFLTKRIG